MEIGAPSISIENDTINGHSIKTTRPQAGHSEMARG
jgi:hypothetical protein